MPATQTDLKSPVAAEIGKFAKLKLTPQHEKLWSETKAAMLWAVPSFSDIWYAMMADKDGEHAWFTDQINTAATDDKYLYVNPEWFFKLTLDERLFVCCHEIEHAMFGHAGLSYMLDKQEKITYPDGVTLPFDHDTMNCAMDYVINDQLITAKIGSMPEHGLHWPSLINGDMGVLDAYRAIYKQRKGGGTGKRTSKQGQTQGDGSGKSFDKLLKPGQGQGKSPNKAMSERSESEWQMQITAAMESAKLRGQLPANLDRMFTKQLKPKADWRDLYQIAVSRRVGNDRYTWETLEPQFIYRGIGAPGRTTFGCNLIVIAVDTSGSIDQHTLDVFMTETVALLEQAKPRRVVLVQCDAYVHEWREIDIVGDLLGTKLKGGGGTDFCPVFERVTREGNDPDLLVYLTDMYGSFPQQAPAYPVIWGSVTPKEQLGEYKAPFGETVFIPPQHTEA